MRPRVFPRVVCLTVNRSCNMNCEWCYSKGAQQGSSPMPLDLSCSLADLAIDVGARELILIGGEPTLWPFLRDFNEYIAGRVPISMVTNGLRFSDQSFRSQYREFSIRRTGLSLKASSRGRVVGTHAERQWESMLEGIREALTFPNSTITFVCHPDDHNIIDAASLTKQLGGDRLHLSLYTPTFTSGKWESAYSWSELRHMLSTISSLYLEAADILDGKLFLRSSYPFCAWPAEYIPLLMQKQVLSSGCMVSRRNGLVFDTDGSVLSCNHLFPYPIGKYGTDFTTLTEFQSFLEDPAILDVYNQLSRYPSSECKECSYYGLCGGSCPVLWTVFHPDDVISRKGGD
ncbi:MAG: hypothetical protein GHCLOJNM_00192 [bacterium]|nr:hypothetical protein [bacterium]